MFHPSWCPPGMVNLTMPAELLWDALVAMSILIRLAEVEHISAVTFAVRDMACSVAFYRQLGFTMLRGGEDASFSSFRFGEAFVNLAAVSTYKGQWWGRVIFPVTQVDAYHQTLTAAGLQPDKPMDAPWGERFFHISDPDGHELSFAELLLSRLGVASGRGA